MADPLSRVFSALADPTRRDIVARLAVGDATVNELAAPYDVSVQAVSKHLKVLEDAGLVTRSRDAQRRPVHLEAEVFDLMTEWIERYRRQAEERYRRLDDVLADAGRRRPPTNADTAGSTAHEHPHDRGRDRGRPDRPDHPHHPRVRRTPEQVFRAHTDPDLVAQWLGPDGLQIDDRPLGRRTGGSYRYVATRGDDEHAFRGSFHEVRPDRIVQTFTWEGMPDGVALETLVFEDLGDGRTRLHATSLCDTFEARDGWLRAAWRSASTRATRSSTGCCADGVV